MPAPTLPKLPRPETNFTNVPDPDTLPPEVFDKLMAQPWLQRVIALSETGKTITPEIMEEESKKPGAMGYKIHEFDLGDGRKTKLIYDVATGEPVSPEKLIRSDFQPTIKALKDPVTGKPAGTALMTSPNSAVPYEKPDVKAPLMQDFYKASPILDDQNSPIGHVFIGPDGQVNIVKKGNDLGPLAALFGNGAGAQPTPAKPATPQAAPVKPAAPQATPSYQVKTAEDYARVPSGASYIDPKGIRRTKP